MLKNLLQQITDRVQADPDAAKAFFELGTKPTAGWLRKIEPGVNAAQHLVDAVVALQECPPGPPDGKEADFGLGVKDSAPTPPPLPQAPTHYDNAEVLAKLRSRVRVAPDADIDAIMAAVLAGAWSRRVMMLTPLALPILPAVHFAHMAQLRSQPWMGYFQESDTILQVARNKCAHAFLQSEAEWAWMVDGDCVPSWGDPAFFYDIKRLGVDPGRIAPDWLKMKAVERLMSHGKSIVGAVYQQRRKRGAICSPADLRPQPTLEEKDAILQLRNRGPKDKLLEVDWCATGCLLVHRKVFDDIKAKRPDLAPRKEGDPWNFFGHDVGRQGEDAAFGVMAKECGHQSYLDMGCWVAHLGTYAFMPEPV